MFLHIILAKLWVAREINEPHSERVRGEEPGLLAGDTVGEGAAVRNLWEGQGGRMGGSI